MSSSRFPAVVSALRPPAAPPLAALLLAACACSGGGAEHGGGGFTQPPTVVEAATIEAGGVVDRFTAVGSVQAAETVEVAAEVDGRIASMPFEEGATVAAGAVLVQLDDREHRAELARTRALAENARTRLRRIERLVGEGISPEQAGDDLRAELRVAEADVAVAEARLAKTVVTAPFSGVVGERRLSPGAWVRSGDVVTTLSQIDEVEVAFAAPERYLSDLRPGAEVSLEAPAFPEHPLKGRVTLVDPVLDPTTRTAAVTARAANPAGRFLPGMSADVSVVLDERPQALVVPAEAVFFEGDQALVYVIQADSTVAPAPLTLGTRLADSVEVLSGATAGTRVVRAGHQKLYPGAAVQVMEQPAAAARAGS